MNSPFELDTPSNIQITGGSVIDSFSNLSQNELMEFFENEKDANRLMKVIFVLSERIMELDLQSLQRLKSELDKAQTVGLELNLLQEYFSYYPNAQGVQDNRYNIVPYDIHTDFTE